MNLRHLLLLVPTTLTLLVFPLASHAQPLGSTPFGYVNPVGNVQLSGGGAGGVGGVGGLNNLGMARGIAGGVGVGIGLAILDNLLSSPTPSGPTPAQIQAQLQAQQQAAARAAEAQRLAQIQTAAQWRAFWDASDQNMTDQLQGVFDIGPQTDFFGLGGPDPNGVAQILQDDSSLAFGDPNVVDLSDIPDVLSQPVSINLSPQAVGSAPQTPSYSPPGSLQPSAPSPTPPDAFLKWGMQKEIGYMKKLEWEGARIGFEEYGSKIPGYATAMATIDFIQSTRGFSAAVKLYDTYTETREEYENLKDLMQGRIVQPLLEKDMANITAAASGNQMPYDPDQMGHGINSEAYKSAGQHFWDGLKEAHNADKESSLEEGRNPPPTVSQGNYTSLQHGSRLTGDF
jgi:hypothetical protein